MSIAPCACGIREERWSPQRDSIRARCRACVHDVLLSTLRHQPPPPPTHPHPPPTHPHGVCQVVKRLGQVVTDSNDRPKDEVKIYKGAASAAIV